MRESTSGPGRTRSPSELRPANLEVGVAPFAEGSCLVSMGRTRVLCTASVEEEVPPWRRDSGLGWVTAEYSMLPRATASRTPRERNGPKGRTQEIQRLIGRSLRAVVDLEALGSRTVLVDCDVLQADGGTRTAAVTGGYVALARAVRGMRDDGALHRDPLDQAVAAVSVGLVHDELLLDLEYVEDRDASVDLNVVGTADGQLVEVQGTAEDRPFPRGRLDDMVDLAQNGIARLVELQQGAVEAPASPGP